MGVNKCIIVGNLGRDPELKYTQNGNAVCNFSVAVSEKFKGEDKTEWFNVVTWNKVAEICAEYLQKGSQVYLEGKIQTRKWEDKDGGTKYTTELVAFQMQMLDRKESRKDTTQENGRGGYDQPASDDDIPF